MELYYMIGITDRKRSQRMLELCAELEFSMVLTKLGRGTASREQLALYDLDDSEKALIGTVTDASGMKQLMRLSKKKLFIDIPGNGILMAIPVKSVGGGRTLAVSKKSYTRPSAWHHCPKINRL